MIAPNAETRWEIWLGCTSWWGGVGIYVEKSEGKKTIFRRICMHARVAPTSDQAPQYCKIKKRMVSGETQCMRGNRISCFHNFPPMLFLRRSAQYKVLLRDSPESSPLILGLPIGDSFFLLAILLTINNAFCHTTKSRARDPTGPT